MLNNCWGSWILRRCMNVNLSHFITCSLVNVVFYMDINYKNSQLYAGFSTHSTCKLIPYVNLYWFRVVLAHFKDPSLCFQPLWHHKCLSLSSRFDINVRVVSKTKNQSFRHSLWLFELLVFKIEKSEIVQTARWIFLIGNCKI